VAPSTGFGQPKSPKNSSKSAKKRAQASEQYDQMKAKGLPEFTIFIRIQGKNNWFPVGSLAVNRTSKINQAIFDQEAELLQGAFRLFPILKKHQSQLEYGYRLKQFADEPIQVATRPQAGAEGVLQGLKNRVTGLLKRQ
jgi:hypothetical protein